MEIKKVAWFRAGLIGMLVYVWHRMGYQLARMPPYVNKSFFYMVLGVSSFFVIFSLEMSYGGIVKSGDNKEKGETQRTARSINGVNTDGSTGGNT